MTHVSVLFDKSSDEVGSGEVGQPDCFADLNLDQVVDAVTAGKEEYDLKAFFYRNVQSEPTIEYRHQVMRDLERLGVLGCINRFASSMRKVRACLQSEEKLFYTWQKRRWHLEAAHLYCDAIRDFSANLEVIDLHSAGLQRIRDYVQRYVLTDTFLSLLRGEACVRTLLDQVHYTVHIDGDSVIVCRYDDEPDYSIEVLNAFEKFRQRELVGRRIRADDYPNMNHVEAKILDCVVRLHGNAFNALTRFCEDYASFFDPTIVAFDHEVQFYVAYLEHMQRIAEQGVTFCYPVVSGKNKIESVAGSFDLALAEKLRRERRSVVCNDYWLEGTERIMVVTGPNQGGKTTFARMFGQLHFLASLGLPVPGTHARLFLQDQVFAHFEREEDMKNLRGKLHDDLLRIRRILDEATPRSVIIMNEIFSSTSLKDAIFLSKKVMAKIMALDALAVYVTFIEELSRLSGQTLSMSSEISIEDDTSRTFKVRRRPADGKAYAVSLASKYRLTYKQLAERLSL
ncbi:DNA mismatch repair protein MutS [Burkholderia pseudomultivorans]|uniref:DNA mismatch repair protein MutS n=1 Tax=Burkholderia pseudomultivorans TaxID=1207504 RepID=A0A6P2R648_9BURK|nr:DNA mismatch repair protein MutS [Burkholderia pseudomultivorans]VWC31740.1 DNA mismatch repair protein MutS [Burkholderia pseudomultivorans]